MEEKKLKVKSSCCSSGSDCNTTTSEYIKPIAEAVQSSDPYWVTGPVKTSVGNIAQVSTKLERKDILGAMKVRFGFNRMNYKVNPGIYCVGYPDNTSQVLVTANYKLTFDALRKELDGLNAWILVLDTKGINVWCAAGKGTFGTKELVNRISKVKLSQLVSHNTVILPQLGAPGVAAHIVKKLSGFNVIYGPVRAEDVKEFLNLGMKATPQMRTVKFTFWDRLVLTPIELKSALSISLIVFGILFILNQIGLGPFGFTDFYSFIGVIFIGCVLTQVLLPFIPGRAFAWKGWILGFIWAVAVNVISGWPASPEYSLIRALGYMLILPSVSSFIVMNFTGASTYTSFSGVIKEMKIAVPIIIGSIGLGSILILINNILKL